MIIGPRKEVELVGGLDRASGLAHILILEYGTIDDHALQGHKTAFLAA